MANIPERRHNARLTIPSQFSDPGLADQQVRLVDLSPKGARIEHLRVLVDRSMCFLYLPRALGGVRLRGQVIWSHITGFKPVVGGKSGVVYQSGLTFALLTPEQRAGLARALEILRSGQGASPPARPAGEAPGERGKTAKGRA